MSNSNFLPQHHSYTDCDECSCAAVNQEKVSQLKAKMFDEEKILDLADLFKLFADSTRTKILVALEKDELCVCDLSALLNLSKSLISHQLRKLREANLVKARKDGKMAYYSLDDDHIHDLLKIALAHLDEIEGHKNV